LDVQNPAISENTTVGVIFLQTDDGILLKLRQMVIHLKGIHRKVKENFGSFVPGRRKNEWCEDGGNDFA